jgi:hypothetical protein
VRSTAAVFLFFNAFEPELEWRLVGFLRRVLRFQWRLLRRLFEQLARELRRFAVGGRRCQRWRVFFFTRLIRRFERWRQRF